MRTRRRAGSLLRQIKAIQIRFHAPQVFLWNPLLSADGSQIPNLKNGFSSASSSPDTKGLAQSLASASDLWQRSTRYPRMQRKTPSKRALKSRKALQAREKLAARSAFVESGHVFQTELSGVIRPDRATEMFTKLAKRIRIEVTSLHSLRPTAVSWLIAAGVDVRTGSAIGGHASATMTLSI